ncbi:hypothetical protein G7046_g7380 [Stylonectria norvegica]|nr:hypothetical protein G7046_g7380 [Stylonectria norvegica]
MRLINTYTLELEEFHEEIPPYAALSHTWGAVSDEVSFQDMMGPRIKFQSKKGIHKIKLCANQALKDGLRYCWVDTCCIDKSSSAELSEAINSMFAWYRNSTRCYVYFVDVDCTDSSVNLYVQLKKARWFTRGWTLQELIAPRSRFFFDQNWTCVGQLQDQSCGGSEANGFYPGDIPEAGSSNTTQPEMEPFGVVVCKITHIPALAIQTEKWKSYSASTKMSWASKRATTRVEDMAYCLLGIFDINMPLLYGERENSFIRLQSEIIKREADHTLFCWVDRTASESSFRGFLATSPAHFSSGSRLTSFSDDGNAYEMTNRGLHLQLRLIQSEKDPEEYHALLNVHGGFGPEDRVYVLLRRITPTGQFVRVDVHRPLDSQLDIKKPLKLGSAVDGHLFIKQDMRFDEIAVIPSPRRISAVTLSNKISPFYTRFGIHTAKIRKHLSNGKLYLPWTWKTPKMLCENFVLRTSRNTFIGWYIRVESGKEQESLLAILDCPEDLEKNDVLWRSQIPYAAEIPREAGSPLYKVATRFESIISDGDLVLNISLVIYEPAISDKNQLIGVAKLNDKGAMKGNLA